MKKFRFATIHLVLVGLICFGILVASLRLVSSNTGRLVVFLAVAISVYALLFFQKKGYEESDLERIERLNEKTELSLKHLLDTMPVGVIKFIPDLWSVEWFNPYAELILADQEGDFSTSLVMDILVSQKEAPAAICDINGKKYSLTIDYPGGILYFYDNLSEVRAGEAVSATSPVIGIISIDNYDDATESLADAEVSRLNSLIVKFVAEFTQKYNIFYRRVDMDRFYFFTDYRVLSQLIDSKFTVLEEFRQEAKDFDLPLTMSMGISYGDGNHDEIGSIAQKNLNMALVRGGDQVVVKENDEHKDFIYFGGGTISTVKRSRTRTRAMMTAISDKIKLVDQVFVMGHRNLDMDALGAAVGMEFFASNIISNTYAIYDDKQMAPDIERAVERLQNDGNSQLITVDEALKKVTNESLLIMVDHSKTSLTLSKELYSKFTEVVVVDHHRRDDDFPNNAVLNFIESGASSASELVTELIQFQNASVKLSKLQASVLMAGIMLDTKNFSTRVTSRTFDVASYLRTLGSDSVEIHNISAIDFDEYRVINELILRGEKIWKSVIIASGTEDKTYNNVVSSKAADALLDMSGIEAAFVVTKNSQGNIAISARSRSKINVQRIMEEMGGGGHFNLAACQLENQSVSEALLLLKEKIKEELEEE
ncbi:DHH family phosphoesterase [Streptococcus sp. S784/96/1]|uniref:DHH family phosphoesterase n=1 Tax=Streptococcus sp. S784/96/1 TaxID=2653499 RepID=UPI001389E834|nr:DHH family phosphoesterase [Streptococcus sp. S784/96/1]